MAQVPGVDAGIAAGVDELHALAGAALVAVGGQLAQGAGGGGCGAEFVGQAADAVGDEQRFRRELAVAQCGPGMPPR